MQQRYYDPLIGRFYSNDPVDFLGHLQRGNPTMGFNRYAYANNNPYKYTDPDGEFINFAIGGLIGAVAEIAVQVVVEGKGFSQLDAGRIGQSVAIGAVSGGVGGAASRLVSAAGNVATRGTGTALSSSTSRVLAEGRKGLVSGAASSATSSGLTQYADTGTIDGGKLLQDTAAGAVIGGIAGGVNGAVQADAAQRILSDSRANAIFGPQPGASAGAAAGVVSESSITIAKDLHEKQN